jgi:hypothetical protein
MRPQASIFLIFLTTLYGCAEKAYPDEQFSFSAKYLALIRPYMPGDTMIFKGKGQQADTIVITKIDSTIRNTKGGFINERPYKIIQIYCRQFPFERLDYNRQSTDSNFVFINKYPDVQKESYSISFKRFRGDIEKGSDSLIQKPIMVSNIIIRSYYKVDNLALDLVKDSSDIREAYITNEKGLVAYQDQRGEWWTRIR